MTQATNRQVVFHVNRQFAKIDSRHAIFRLNVESVAFVFTQADDPLMSEEVEPKAFGAVIERLCGTNQEKAHCFDSVVWVDSIIGCKQDSKLTR